MNLRKFGQVVLDMTAFCLSVYFTGGWWLAVSPLPVAIGLTTLWEVGKPVFSAKAAEWIVDVTPPPRIRGIIGGLSLAIALFFIVGSFLQSLAGIKMQEAQERDRVRATDPEIPVLIARVDDLQAQIDSQLKVLAQYNQQGSHAPRTTAAVKALREEQAATIAKLKGLQGVDGGNITAYEMLANATGGRVSGATVATLFGLILAFVVEAVAILVRLIGAVESAATARFSPHPPGQRAPLPPVETVNLSTFPSSLPPVGAQTQNGFSNITPGVYTHLGTPNPDTPTEAFDAPTTPEEGDDGGEASPRKEKAPKREAGAEIETLAFEAYRASISGRDAIVREFKVGHPKAALIQDAMVKLKLAVRNNKGGITLIPGVKIPAKLRVIEGKSQG